MTEKLFPARSRCQGCHKALGREGAPVLRGLFCSHVCACMPAPSTSAAHAVTPRECKTMRDGEWVFKRRYRAPGEIPDKIRNDPSTGSYWCGHCGHLHVGRTLVELPRAQNRGMRRRADLADLLVKARGQATAREVAAVACVRPIRIREWEDSSFDNPSLEALFALLRTYHLDLAVVFGPVSRLASVSA